MVKLQFNIGSMKATLTAIDQFRTSEKKVMRRAIIAAGKELEKGAKKYGALRDGHTLQWMAEVDHPYAKRHGSIQEGTLGHPGWQVHYQTGQLLSAIKSGVGAGGDTYDVYVDTGVAPHAKYVVQGTRIMFARDFIWMASYERDVRKDMMRAMVKIAGKIFRTKGALRFE